MNRSCLLRDSGLFADVLLAGGEDWVVLGSTEEVGVRSADELLDELMSAIVKPDTVDRGDSLNEAEKRMQRLIKQQDHRRSTTMVLSSLQMPTECPE